MIIKEDEIIVSRGKTGEKFVKGVLVETARIDLKITGSIQPEGNIKLIREIFGARTEGAIKIYTKEKLMIYEKDGISDFIEFDGEKYEVSMVKKYNSRIQHNKYTAILRKDEN